MKTSFITDVLSGKTTADRIDDYIEKWHSGTSTKPIAEFLGMTEHEYQSWTTKPSSLTDIIAKHRSQKPQPYQKWISSLREGDEVFFEQRDLQTAPAIERVTKITPTQITTKSHRWNRTNGRVIGGPRYNKPTNIQPVTDEHREQYTRYKTEERVRFLFRNTPVSKIPYETQKQIMETLNPIYRESQKNPTKPNGKD